MIANNKTALIVYRFFSNVLFKVYVWKIVKTPATIKIKTTVARLYAMYYSGSDIGVFAILIYFN